MNVTRDSVYNVSSDIRLEDYATQNGNNNNFTPNMIKLAIIALLISALGYMGYRAVHSFVKPTFHLAIANEYISDTNLVDLASMENVAVKATKPVYIRFQWEELKSDYIRIQIYTQIANGKRKEEAVLGRQRPKTVNYIYFMGPLEKGNYFIEIVDREDEILISKSFEVK